MVTRATEQKGKIRLPQQHVRPGRGVAGYSGGANIEVYPTVNPYSRSEPEKIEARSQTRAQLDAQAVELGINPDDFKTKAELQQAIADAEAKA